MGGEEKELLIGGGYEFVCAKIQTLKSTFHQIQEQIIPHCYNLVWTSHCKDEFMIFPSMLLWALHICFICIFSVAVTLYLHSFISFALPGVLVYGVICLYTTVFLPLSHNNITISSVLAFNNKLKG